VDLNFELKENYLDVKASGDYIYAESESAINKIFSECRNCDYSKILIDAFNIDLGLLTDIKRFFIGKQIAELNRESPRITVAYVVRKQYINEFAETVAHNRGTRFKGFHNRDEAIKWLSE
jgi:hypothetical protein